MLSLSLWTLATYSSTLLSEELDEDLELGALCAIDRPLTLLFSSPLLKMIGLTMGSSIISISSNPEAMFEAIIVEAEV